MRRRAAAVAGALLLSACGLGHAPVGQEPVVALSAETSLAPIQQAFNDAAQETRVILLLSPTCGTCLRGASVVEGVLSKFPQQDVTIFAVWQPMLPTDMSAPSTRTLARLSDRRVRQYWDADHLVAKKLKENARAPQPQSECCTRNGILWDLMAIYPPAERWTDSLPVASFFNGTIVDVVEGLTQTLSGGNTP